MEFLESKRETATRLAGSSSASGIGTNTKRNTATSNAVQSDDRSSETLTCFIHPDNNHSTETCRKFSSLSNEDKYSLLKQHHACFRCLRKHPRSKCQGEKCSQCKRNNHHTLLCRDNSNKNSTSHKSSQDSSAPQSFVSSSHCKSGSSLLPIQDVSLFRSSKIITVFYDSGSNASFITHDAARRCRAKRIRSIMLDLTTTGNVESQYSTHIYEVTLRSTSDSPITILAYGLSEITGKMGELDLDNLKQLFSELDVCKLQRGKYVELLVGSDYTGIHPRKEVARAGENLWVLEGPLGQCVQGAHPDLTLNPLITSQFISIQAHIATEPPTNDLHTEFSSPITHFNKVDAKMIGAFIEGENIGTELAIKCGGCKCSKCPTPGHSFSFVEEQELQLIRQNLKYDEENQYWSTTYPWIDDPNKLPDNYKSALATLSSTERTLRRDPQWAQVYSDQIKDMVDRQVARKLTSKEITSWNGPFFYISHLAVQNPKSTSTPVRIVFNSSQVFQGVSLNSFLTKGPDAYINNLLGVILRWREKEVALVADIRFE